MNSISTNKRTLTVREAVGLFDGFKSLNGRLVAEELTTDDGKTVKKLITIPYEIEDDAVWNIAKNLRILKDQVISVLEDVKERYAKEIVPEGFEKLIPEERAEKVAEINRRIDKHLDKEIELHGLLTIRFEDLNAKKNKITGGMIGELGELVTKGQ